MISVVTAAYNAAAFLPECLQSVESQHGISEHVVVDGGSKDGTIEILQNRSLVRWLSEPDNGQADAFNKGVAMATGEWICWLNADDALAPGAVEAFLQTLAKHPNADVIYGHVLFIDESSRPVKTSYHLPFYYPLLLNGCYVPPSSGTFFRRKWLVEEPLNPDYHFVMDVEWFLRCGQRIQAVLTDRIFSHFRISATAKTSEMIRSGQVTDRHVMERENYRRAHVYSQWPELSEGEAKHKFTKHQSVYRFLYKLMKLRYVARYIRQRFTQS